MNRFHTINSEPVLFLFSVSLGLYITIYQAFIKYKVCLPLATSDVCHHLKNGSDKSLEELVSADAARYSLYLQVCSAIPAFVSSMFIGAWSDANGRKTPLLIAMGGITLNAMLLVFVATVEWLPLWLMLVGAVVSGFLGQLIMVFTSCFAMISDAIKDPTSLTLRISLGSSLIYIGIVCGSLTSSLISTERLSYGYVFLTAGAFSAAGFLYAAFFTRETIHLSKPRLPSNDLDSEPMTLCQSLVHFFHLGRLQDCFRVLVRPRPGRNRCHLNVGVITFLVIFSCDIGMPGLQYLFVTDAPLFFTDSMYSILVAVQTACSAAGLLILPLLIKKVLGLGDTWLITVGFVFSIAKALTFAFSTKLWMVFLSGTCNVAASLYFAGYRAYLSKLVERSETARLFATLSSVEHVGPLLSGVVFNNLYAATLSFFPGFVWALGAGITGAMLILICWLQYDSRTTTIYLDNNSADDQAPILTDDSCTINKDEQ